MSRKATANDKHALKNRVSSGLTRHHMGAGLPHQCEEAPQEAGLKIVGRLRICLLLQDGPTYLKLEVRRPSDLLQQTPFHAGGPSCSTVVHAHGYAELVSGMIVGH